MVKRVGRKLKILLLQNLKLPPLPNPGSWRESPAPGLKTLASNFRPTEEKYSSSLRQITTKAKDFIPLHKITRESTVKIQRSPYVEGRSVLWF